MCLTTLTYLTSSSTRELSDILLTSFFIITCTIGMVHLATTAIRNHAPNEVEMEKALMKSRYALPFWSLLLSVMMVRLVRSIFMVGVSTDSAVSSISWFRWFLGLFSTNWYWSFYTIQSLLTPTLGWGMMSLTILFRYMGPLSPYVQCSIIPLRINPFDAIVSRIGRNCTSRERFLDMIANGLDVLAAPSIAAGGGDDDRVTDLKREPAWKVSTSQTLGDASQQNRDLALQPAAGLTIKARYSRPSLLTIVIQTFMIHAYAGHLFGHTIVLPFLEDMGMVHSHENATVATIILLSCILGSVFELLSSVQEAELRFDRYSSVAKMDLQYMFSQVKRLGMIAMGASVLSSILSHVWTRGHLFLHGHDVPVFSPSLSTTLYSLMLSFVSTGVLVGIMGIQEEFTRWAICSPDINPDLLLNKSIKKSRNNGQTNLFLAEDLYIQSILMGDGATAEKLLSSEVLRSRGVQEDELFRNEQACASFAHWIKDSSTFQPGKISDDILRMCLLQSLGGDSGTQEKSIVKRLQLSAATSAPRAQPIIVPLARSLLAFAGGLGESITECFRQERKDGRIIVRSKNSDSWVLPPSSLTAGKCSILGVARLIVTNSGIEERFRTRHLSLLIPCVLQSAYKLRCGIFEYALFEANATGANLSTPDGNGLLEFIGVKFPELMPVIVACDESAKMVIKCLYQSRDEKVLLRFKGEMQRWIVDLNSQITGRD